MNKQKYRQSKEWKQFRIKVLNHYNYQCQICGVKKKKGLHVHHLNPETYGNETLDDCIPLCSVCHKTIEWLLSKTKNPVNIHSYTENLKDIYIRSK